MATTIRLRRMGAKNQPSYRLVVTDSRNPRDGRFIEILGHYNPRRHDESGEAELSVNVERVLHWMGTGVQISDTVRSLLKKLRVLELNNDRKHGIDITERVAEMTGGTGIATLGVAPKPAGAVKPAPEKPAKAKAKAEQPAPEPVAAEAAEAEAETE